MNTLVTYYSLTGHTATVAETIAHLLGVEANPILEQSARSGLIGTTVGAMNALLGSKSVIAGPAHEPSESDLVIIGTPVWVGAPAPAVNAYIDRYRNTLNRVAFFCTQGKVGGARALALMERRLGHPPLATLEANENDIGGSALENKIESFLSDLQGAGYRA